MVPKIHREGIGSINIEIKATAQQTPRLPWGPKVSDSSNFGEGAMLSPMQADHFTKRAPSQPPQRRGVVFGAHQIPLVLDHAQPVTLPSGAMASLNDLSLAQPSYYNFEAQVVPTPDSGESVDQPPWGRLFAHMQKGSSKRGSYSGRPEDTEDLNRLTIKEVEVWPGADRLAMLNHMVDRVVVRSAAMGLEGRVEALLEKQPPETIQHLLDVGFVPKADLKRTLERKRRFFPPDMTGGSFDLPGVGPVYPSELVQLYLPESEISRRLGAAGVKLEKSQTVTKADLKPLPADSTLFKNMFPDGLSGFGFHQGHRGNCYMVSAMRSFFEHPRHQEFLPTLMQQTGEGQVAFLFPGDRSQRPVVVTDSMEDIEAKTWLYGDRGYMVMERALGQYRVRENYGTGDAVQGLVEDSFDGGHGIDILKLLTNGNNRSITPKGDLRLGLGDEERHQHSFAQLDKRLPVGEQTYRDQVHARLQAIGQHPQDYMATVGTPAGEPGFMDPEQRIHKKHGYSLLGVKLNPSSGVVESVQVSDPHNWDPPMTVSFDQFVQYFNALEVVKLPERNVA